MYAKSANWIGASKGVKGGVWGRGNVLTLDFPFFSFFFTVFLLYDL